MVALIGGACRAVMEKEKRNPNFIYIYSEALQQEIAMSRKTGDLVCADGTKYSAAEVALIASGEVPVTLAEHRVKKLFSGEFIGYDKTGEKGKPAGSLGAEGSGNNPSPSGAVASAPSDGDGPGSGELDIF